MTTYALTIEDPPRDQDVAALANGLTEHALPHTGVPGFKPLGVFLRDDAGTLVGGASGYVKVILALEQAARERGCTHAHLDTFSFQARPFYEKLGYEVFSTLDDYPLGPRRFFLKKALTGAVG